MFMTIARFFQSGGPMMWVILAIGAGALSIILERLFFFYRQGSLQADELASKTAARITDQEISEAMKDLITDDGPTRQLMRRATELAWEGEDADGIQRAVEELAMRQMPRFGHRLNYLAMLANVATLAGLLGTIFGLQQSFSALAVAEAAQKATVLAAGISQAMNTTAFGLMVALPCLMVHARLASMASRRSDDCDAGVTKLLNFFQARDRQRYRVINRKEA